MLRPAQLHLRLRQSRSSPLEAEDSLPLRILVQALVLVGIVATDVAASTSNSFWAIPLSIVGAVWSGYSRRQRNTLVKFGIAVGMIAALVVFLGQLARQTEDSRIILTQLLIQLQVLHSFDLPRRKDLGYSTVIGLILLGVAGTLSQTTAFGIFLLLFLAIALPVLVLDYRSRLGLETQPLPQQGALLLWRKPGRSLKRLPFYLVIFAATVGLGLIIFAVMPRLPGYQLRTFPVSAAIDVQGEFDGQRVMNPGYVSSGGSGTLGEGEGKLAAQAFDPNFYYGFNNEINQNLRGDLIPQTLMRVRSQAAGFWRVLAFDRYTGQGWQLSRNEETQILKRSNWSYQFSLPKQSSQGSTKEVVQTYTIVSSFTNLIPALGQPRELYFPTREVAFDPTGGLRSPVTLPEGLTYTVVSDVPYRDRSLLRTATTTYPAEITRTYLQVPESIKTKVRQQAEVLLASANRPITEPYEQALFLAQALKQKYALQFEIPPLGKDEDLVEAFLFRFEGGYPDHFSTVLTIMLRSLGIPARLVTGLDAGEFNPFTGLYIVKNTDAYALAEVYFPDFGWFAFDPIPGHPLVPPSVEVDQTFTVLQQFWNWVAGWLPSPVTGFLIGLFTWLGAAISRFLGLFSSGLGGVVTATLITLGGVVLGWFGWQCLQLWDYHRRLARLSPIERLYQQMLDWLALRGMVRQPWQTPLEYVQQVRQTANTAWTEIVTDISQSYMSWRYGGQQPDLSRLQQQLRTLRKMHHTGWQHPLQKWMRKPIKPSSGSAKS